MVAWAMPGQDAKGKRLAMMVVFQTLITGVCDVIYHRLTSRWKKSLETFNV